MKSIETSRDWSEFIALPWSLYDADAHWVPPLRASVAGLLNQKQNPFFAHAKLKAWMVFQGNRCVGRVAAVVDEAHNAFHQEKTGFFGFFETINDAEVVRLLMDQASSWLKNQGMERLRGPVDLSTNYQCGLLVEGFTDSPTVMMNYHPPFYGALLEGWGFKKAKDLHAYELDGRKITCSPRLIAYAERFQKRHQVCFRGIRMKSFDEEINAILSIYNDAWESNWGFVPLDPEEFRHIARDLKLILDPRLCLIAEREGEPIAFALALPDVNQILKKVKNGKLLPWGWLKLFWYLKGPGRKKVMNRCRIVTLGIKKKYQSLGVGPIFYTEYFKRGPELGYPVGEASWILEDNEAMRKALMVMDAQKTKTYRIYDRILE